MFEYRTCKLADLSQKILVFSHGGLDCVSQVSEAQIQLSETSKEKSDGCGGSKETCGDDAEDQRNAPATAGGVLSHVQVTSMGV